MRGKVRPVAQVCFAKSVGRQDVHRLSDQILFGENGVGVLHQDLLSLVVERLPLSLVGLGAGLLQQRVHLGIGVLAIVEAATRVEPPKHVAVGIDPATPADQGRVELVRLGIVEHLAEFLDLDVHRDVGLALAVGGQQVAVGGGRV